VLQSTRVPPMEGVRELMQAGIAAGLTLAVGTSSIKRFVDVSLERMFAAMASPELNVGIFATIVCGDDPDISARKPAPDIYLRCAERIDVEPPSCMVLEDSGSGMLSARRAGIGWPIAVPNKYTHGHDFTGAYGVLRSVQDVVSLDFFPAMSALT
jgi:pseudouridine-5'-monophosphatase